MLAIWKNNATFAETKNFIIMIKRSLTTIASLLITTCMMAQSYSAMWKQVETASQKDLPKDKLQLLDKISKKAESERQYGHLLKAMLMTVETAASISPDSTSAQIQRIEERTQTIGDSIAKAVMRSALGRIYNLKASGTADLDEKKTFGEKSRNFYKMSLADANLLASVKAETYKPFIVEEDYSRIFDNDLLHVLGYEAKEYRLLHDFYAQKGNRHAECITALEIVRSQPAGDETYTKKSKCLQSIDSLINLYGDLRTGGELAVERFRCMERSQDATAAEKVQYINYALSRWGNWPGLNYLRNAKTELERPAFNINAGERMMLPEVARKLRVNSIRNISQLNMAVYRLSLSGDTNLDPNNEKDIAQIKKHIVGTVVCTDQLKYVGKAPYDEFADSMTIVPLPVGVYLLEVSTDNKAIATQRCLLHVTGLFTMSQSLPDKNIRIAVVDATTGKPVAGAKVRLGAGWRNNKEVLATVVTGKNGDVVYKYGKKRPYMAYTYTDKDKASAEVQLGSSYPGYAGQKQEWTIVNTDRSLYRPRQKVQISAICWNTDKNELKAETAAGKTLTISLRNANYEEVEKTEVTTDKFGQASASFDIPASMLSGNWTVIAGNARKTIKVEKYKRPTFEVEMEKVDFAYNAGDTLTVSGTARSFAGTPIQNAKVRYTITRKAMPWYRWWYGAENETMLLTDSAVTDDKGRFNLRMPMTLPETKQPDVRLYYDINAVADVTSMTGETHQGALSLPLSNVSTVFTCDLPDKSLADSLLSMTFSYMNIAKEKIEGNVKYTIDGKEYSAQANTTIDMKALKLGSGLHKLNAICGNDTIKRDFVVFTLNDKKAPVETHDWFYQSSETFPCTIQAGNSDDEHYIYYNMQTHGKVLAKGVVEGHDCLHTRTLEYKPEYGDGITITMAWVNNGKMYTHEAKIQRPQPDKSLKMEWTSFRNKLTPGQDEKWTLKITTNDGKPADAQMMATIYDKSLDAIKQHSLKKITQNTAKFFTFSLPWARWSGGSDATTGLYGYQDFKMLPEKQILLSHFDDACFLSAYMFSPYMKNRTMRIRGTKAMDLQEVVPQMSYAKVMASEATSDLENADGLQGVIAGLDISGGTGGTTDDEAGFNTSAQIRENFAETAFFAPDLTTDKDGSVTLAFTLPESATTWRMLALAHDRQMNSGTLEAEAIASKKVMVQPYMPRFVRQGDKAVVASMITNTTTSDLRGTIRMEISDAETGKIVAKQDKSFSLTAEGSTSADFDIQLPEGLYVCKIMATGKGFTDGEQHYLPVLCDKEMVANTLPFTQTEPGTMSIDLKKLISEKAENGKISIEYTNNPAWLVMQALPTVSDYSNKNALSLAAAYYATVAAKSIIAGCPEFKEALENWKTDSTSLISDLERNEELKSIILSESPWLAEANNEAGQKAMLTNYFNKNNLAYKLSSISNLLADLQNADGSFSWWKGMTGNSCMTTTVATLMARLNTFGQLDKKVGNMLGKAMDYLHKAADKRVEELKKEKNPQLSYLDLDYLYLCAICPNSLRDNNTIKYLKSLLLKSDRKTSIRYKAVAAIVLGKDNNTAREYVESIKQFTVSKPDMGRYFDTPRASYSWRDYRIPTHVAAMEAIRAITPDDKTTLSEMQLWLLQQKRTQAWDTPIISADAIHAFLTENSKALATQEQTVISIDGKQIALPEATAKVGYVKTTAENSKAKTITFDKTSEGTSWGAVYAQALVPATEIENSTSGIKVERSLSTDAKALKVGDKVTMKITITADRDYDFVQVSEQRAACLEPVAQLSGYRGGYYIAPQDNCTNYFFDRLAKGKHVIETEYYVVRQGVYSSGSCTAECAYSPAFAGRAKQMIMSVGGER